MYWLIYSWQQSNENKNLQGKQQFITTWVLLTKLWPMVLSVMITLYIFLYCLWIIWLIRLACSDQTYRELLCDCSSPQLCRALFEFVLFFLPTTLLFGSVSLNQFALFRTPVVSCKKTFKNRIHSTCLAPSSRQLVTSWWNCAAFSSQRVRDRFSSEAGGEQTELKEESSNEC